MIKRVVEQKEIILTQDKKENKVKETKLTVPAEFIERLKINPKDHVAVWSLLTEGRREILTINFVNKNAKKKNRKQRNRKKSP